jgi:hypothetical protein
MNLSPELINRLITLKSLLDLGDMELVAIASLRLEKDRQEPDIAEILNTLEAHRYADAADLINKLLADGTRLAQWIDPDIALLNAELERVSAMLADLETEQAELEHLVARYQAAFHESLGERIARLLKLRLSKLLQECKVNPEKEEAYEQAKKDFVDFEEDKESQKEADARTNWKLSEEEQKELKRLFRAGSKHCHPDLVSPEHKEAASVMFMELRKAYDEGDLLRIRMLVDRCEAGLFDGIDDAGDNEERKKERLKAKIASIRESLERTSNDIGVIKESATYKTMTKYPDWDALFEKQARQLDQEIKNLSETMKEPSDNES